MEKNQVAHERWSTVRGAIPQDELPPKEPGLRQKEDQTDV